MSILLRKAGSTAWPSKGLVLVGAEADADAAGIRCRMHGSDGTAPASLLFYWQADEERALGAVELIGMAGSLSLLAGWRLYASILAAGIAMRLGIIDLPERLDALDVLANPWIIAAAGFGTLAELLADKVAWLDSLWDTVHTLIRPAGGALLALAVVDAGDPVWQVVTVILGGSAALLSHGAKAGARAVVNTSPEPVSNMVVSISEDIATAGSLWFVLAHPTAAVVVALLVLAAALLLIVTSWRALRGIRRRLRGEPR